MFLYQLRALQTERHEAIRTNEAQRLAARRLATAEATRSDELAERRAQLQERFQQFWRIFGSDGPEGIRVNLVPATEAKPALAATINVLSTVHFFEDSTHESYGFERVVPVGVVPEYEIQAAEDTINMLRKAAENSDLNPKLAAQLVGAQATTVA